ncbi:MAG: MATE family efflux transporter [Gammaproteobacteria bacterium]
MDQIPQPHSIQSEIKNSISLSVPMITAQLIYASSSFLGTAMIARLGKDALAASVLISLIWLSLSVLFFGILNAVSVLVAHQHGARNNKAISDIMGQSFILGAVLSVLIILSLSTMPLFITWSGQPEHVLKYANQYMYSLLWMIPGLALLNICEQFLIGIGRTRMVLRISMLVVPIEIPLIYMFIFGKCGSPEFGVAGVGYGFAVTYTTTAVFLIWYLAKANAYQKFQIFNGITRIKMRYLKELIRIGLPMGCMQLIEVSAFAFATFYIAQFGTSMLAAHQIVMQYLGFAITIVFAMSQAVTVRVGHAVGRQDLVGVKYAVYVGMLLNFFFVMIIALSFYFMPNFYLSLDLSMHDPANALLIKHSTELLSICAVLFLFDNFRIIGYGALRALKDTYFSMYASFIGLWIVGVSLGYVFGFVFHYQGAGVWWALTLGIATAALMVFARLQFLLKRVDLTKLL